MNRRSSASSPKGTIIINYHYLEPDKNYGYCGLRGVRLDSFERQLSTLKRQFHPISPLELPLEAEDQGHERSYLITFDDGCQDIFDRALPLLLHHNTPVIIYCCSQPYIEKRVLNVQKTHLLYGKWGWKRFRNKFQAALANIKEPWRLENSAHLGLAPMYRYDDEETGNFKRQLNVEIPYSIVGKALDMLFESEFGPQQEIVKKLYLSPNAIRRCADQGVAIGIHSHTHCMLSRLSAGEQAQELSLPMSYFQDELGIKVHSISYPYGIPGSWDQQTKNLAKLNGLTTGMTLGREVYNCNIHRDALEIPRFDVNDVFTKDGELKDNLVP